MAKLNLAGPPQHPSYKAHRRQFWIQILLPVLIATLLLVIAPITVWITRMGAAGAVVRWAAISTMFLLIPVMIVLAIVFVVLVSAIYVSSRVGAWLPRYSLRAQKLAGSAAAGTRLGAEMVRKPVLAVRALGSLARSQFRRLRERV